MWIKILLCVLGIFGVASALFGVYSERLEHFFFGVGLGVLLIVCATALVAADIAMS